MEDNSREIARAFRECERCGGRTAKPPDCSDECRYWRLTASQAEREELQRRGATKNPRAREWTGPVAFGVEEAA